MIVVLDDLNTRSYVKYVWNYYFFRILHFDFTNFCTLNYPLDSKVDLFIYNKYYRSEVHSFFNVYGFLNRNDMFSGFFDHNHIINICLFTNCCECIFLECPVNFTVSDVLLYSLLIILFESLISLRSNKQFSTFTL